MWASCGALRGLDGIGKRGRDAGGGAEHVGPEVVDGDGALGGFIDGAGVLGGNIPATCPLADRRLADIAALRQRRLTASDMEGA